MSRIAPISGETPAQYARRQTEAWSDEYHVERRKKIAREVERILADDERLGLALARAVGERPEMWAIAMRSIARSSSAGDMFAVQALLTAAVYEQAEESI